MKITTVRLSNFQSFGPEPTTVDLEDLTYVLGPNGSGKTATLEALSGYSARWQLSGRFGRGIPGSRIQLGRPGVGFLAVMDLTSQTRRVPLGDAVRVVTVPPAEPNGLMETVMVVKVQANLPSPSYQSTPTAARARAAAGVQIGQVPVT